jgi:hypothetical protein
VQFDKHEVHQPIEPLAFDSVPTPDSGAVVANLSRKLSRNTIVYQTSQAPTVEHFEFEHLRPTEKDDLVLLYRPNVLYSFYAVGRNLLHQQMHGKENSNKN